MMSRSLSLALVALVACHDAPQPAPVVKAPTPEVDAGAGTDASASVPKPPSLRELASAEDWPAVIAAIDALPESERGAPKVRFLRARAALETKDYKAARAALEGVSLPALSEDVDRMRASAALEVGPYAEAAAYFAKRTDTLSILSAARASLQAGEKARALALATKVVQSARSRGAEAKARALRLRTGIDPEETADARWLLTKGADLAEAADAMLAKKAPALTRDELVTRMRALADAGRVEDALAEASKLGGLEEKRARGDVLYRGRRYESAAAVLAECAKAGGAYAESDAFHAARALSRADHDEDAARAWAELIQKSPKSPWADESAFMIARLDFLHAKWAEAARGFDAYLQAHPAGVERKDALRGRAIAKLLSGDAASARKLFGELIKSESDPLARARLENLQAIAASKLGDAKAAEDTWRRIATSAPLTWPALVARARLSEMKAPLPPAIGPAPSESGAPLARIELPADVALLHELGLDTDAERRLMKQESALHARAESLCAAYGSLDRGHRRFALSFGLPGLDLAPSASTRWAWECAFPAPYGAVVSRVEASEHLPTGLTHAVMRQESAFDPEVVSPARAIGLMQLLPETADAVAKEMSVEHDVSMLARGAHNTTLGGHYLASLLARFKSSLPLAIASYNCGPEAVEKWTGRAPGLDVDMFVETIPYLETRNYVVRVMGNYARYAYLAKGDAPALDLAIPR